MEDKVTEYPRPAGFWVRGLALWIDFWLYVGLLGLLGNLSLLSFYLIAKFTEFKFNIDLSRLSFGIIFISILPIGLFYLYWPLFESTKLKATPGKLYLGLKIESTDGTQIGLFRALWRNLAKWIFSYSLTFTIGFIAATFTKRKLALHDVFAGTRVWQIKPLVYSKIFYGLICSVILGAVLLLGPISILTFFGAKPATTNLDSIQKNQDEIVKKNEPNEAKSLQPLLENDNTSVSIPTISDNGDSADSVPNCSSVVLLLVDKSRSMAEVHQKVDLFNNLTAEASKISDDKCLGLIAFDSGVLVVANVSNARQAVEGIKRKVKSIIYSGRTDLIPALAIAHNMLSRVDAQSKSIIIITDGKLPLAGNEHLDQIAKFNNSQIKISTIAVGDSADIPFMQMLAQYGGGSFYEATSSEKLADGISKALMY
jgi:uncharacterized RDD family membrane protein YckC